MLLRTLYNQLANVRGVENIKVLIFVSLLKGKEKFLLRRGCICIVKHPTFM